MQKHWESKKPKQQARDMTPMGNSTITNMKNSNDTANEIFNSSLNRSNIDSYQK